MLRRIALATLIAGFLVGAAAPPSPVRVTTVALTKPGAALTLSGTVQARTLADLAFRIAGKIVARPIEIGDHVHAGQILARLDPADLLLSEQASQAALQAAVADAANARADLARYQALGRTSAAYLASQYDRRISASRMAEARLVQAQRQFALAHDQSGYGNLRADADGVITALPVQVGQVVTAGQTVASLAHTDQTEIWVDVPENRLNDVRNAGEVTVTLWAAPDQTFRGKVREIGALADPATRTFAVKLSVANAPLNLLALGMTAAVCFGLGGANVAVIPATALTDDAGHPAVWVLDGPTQRAHLRPVTIASYTGDGTVVIAAGLNAGESVVTAGTAQITSNTALVAWKGAAR